MRILALDSSGLVASVAVVEDGAVDDQVIAEYTVNYKKTHSQTLLPMLDEIVKMTELDLLTICAESQMLYVRSWMQDAGRCMRESMNLTDRSFTYWKTRWQFR